MHPFDLIGERPTNRLDLQYLYYLPFTKLFSSNDNLHKRVIPYFLNRHQDFIIGEELKRGLKNIISHNKKINIKDDGMSIKKPPIIEDSITFQMWNKYFDYPPKHLLPDDKPKEWYIEKMKEFENAYDLELDNYHGEQDFIAKKSIMSSNDPCFCGSGKMFKDCHLPNDYFEKKREKK